VDETRTESNKKAKDLFSSSSNKQKENWKDMIPKEMYAFTGILIAVGQNRGKKEYVQTKCGQVINSLHNSFYSNNVKGWVQIKLLIHKI
jgi:hypothetical protein